MTSQIEDFPSCFYEACILMGTALLEKQEPLQVVNEGKSKD